jgi:hypothetical protein
MAKRQILSPLSWIIVIISLSTISPIFGPQIFKFYNCEVAIAFNPLALGFDRLSLRALYVPHLLHCTLKSYIEDHRGIKPITKHLKPCTPTLILRLGKLYLFPVPQKITQSIKKGGTENHREINPITKHLKPFTFHLAPCTLIGCTENHREIKPITKHLKPCTFHLLPCTL